MRLFKLVETATGRIASFGRWTFPLAKPTEGWPADASDAERERDEQPAPLTEFPDGANVAALTRMQDKYVDGENMYVMGLLGGRPCVPAARVCDDAVEARARYGRCGGEASVC